MSGESCHSSSGIAVVPPSSGVVGAAGARPGAADPAEAASGAHTLGLDTQTFGSPGRSPTDLVVPAVSRLVVVLADQHLAYRSGGGLRRSVFLRAPSTAIASAIATSAIVTSNP
jgi:hypothetical protein